MIKQYKSAYVEITNVCNLNCSFCDQTTRVKEFMDLQQFSLVLDEVKPLVDEVYFHVMGEPLLHPQLEEFLSLADTKDISVNITTNARLLEEKLDILINARALKQIDISLHSYCENEIDYNGINKTIKLARVLIENNKRVVLKMWDNIMNDELKNILICEFGDIQLTEKPMSKLDENIYLSIDKQFTWPKLDNEEIDLNNNYCHALDNKICILVDGTVTPCFLDNNATINIGNIFSTSLKEILSSKRLIEMREGFKQGKCTEELCRHCGYRTLDFKI